MAAIASARSGAALKLIVRQRESGRETIGALIEAHRKAFARLDRFIEARDEAVEAAFAAGGRVLSTKGGEGEFEHLAVAEHRARRALLKAPVMTLEEFAAKARYLLAAVPGSDFASLEEQDVKDLLESVCNGH